MKNLVVFIRKEGEKQYHRTGLWDYPDYEPKKGWKVGKRYKNYLGNIYIVDSVDCVKGGEDEGYLRLHVTKLERK